MSNSTSKASLFLMELIMSILFFSLSAAVCVQLFVKSHALSQQSLKLNYAVIASESMAEAFYSSDGDLEKISSILDGAYYNEGNQSINIYYNADFDTININDFMYDGRYILNGVLEKNGRLCTLKITYNDYKASQSIYELSPVLYINTEDF